MGAFSSVSLQHYSDTNYSDALSDPKLLRWLVERGTDLNAPYMYGITLFGIATQSAPRETVELLLELGASVQHGDPLHAAVWNNRENEIIELLLNSGASPSAIATPGEQIPYADFVNGLGTPLHVAYRMGNHRLVQLLLKHGANPNIKDSNGKLPNQVRKNHCPLNASI